MNALDRIVYETAVKEAVLQVHAALVADVRTGEVLYATTPAAALFGYQADDLLGRCVDELLPDEVQAHHAAYRAAYALHPRARPVSTGLVLRGRHADGSEFPLQVGLTPVSVLDRAVVVASIVDLTEPVKTAALIQQLPEEEPMTTPTTPATPKPATPGTTPKPVPAPAVPPAPKPAPKPVPPPKG